MLKSVYHLLTHSFIGVYYIKDLEKVRTNPTIQVRWEAMQKLHNSDNDYSRKSWVYFMSEESDAFDIFKKFRIMVEKDSRNFIV